MDFYTPDERAEVADRRAARGAALLDERVPGWASLVDTDALNLASPYACVLGQVFDPDDGVNHGFRVGLIELFGDDRYALTNLETPVEANGFNLAAANGFNLAAADAVRGVDFNDLRLAWTRQVVART